MILSDEERAGAASATARIQNVTRGSALVTEEPGPQVDIAIFRYTKTPTSAQTTTTANQLLPGQPVSDLKPS